MNYKISFAEMNKLAQTAGGKPFLYRPHSFKGFYQ